MVSDPHPWLAALRASQDRLAAATGSLGEEDLARRSYDPEWSVAQVLSHMGSQAEIFARILDAGLSGGPPFTVITN